MTIITLPLTDAKAIRIAKEAALDSSRIVFTAHARLRMRQRRITGPEIIACLRGGRVTEPVHQDIKGRWQCAITGISSGEPVTVAAGFQWDAKRECFLIVVNIITVY